MSDDDQTPKAVMIGDRRVTIDGITGWKFLEAAELIAQITEALPEIYDHMEEFVQKRMAATEKTWTRAAAIAQWGRAEFAGLSDEQWEAMGNEVRLPGPRPNVQEQIAQVFPEILSKMRPKVMRLLAVLAAPNGEVEQAVMAGGEGIEALMVEWETRLLLGRVNQLVKVAVMAIDAFKAEASEDPEVAALLGRLPELLTGAAQASAPVEAQEGETTDENERTEKPTSSSDLPTPSDGTGDRPSTDLDGGSSDESVSASTAVR